MPAYHSSFNQSPNLKAICNVAILPLKTKYNGPAPRAQGDGEDVIDEAIKFFKANCLFRNYEMKGTADRVICYLTLYISQCINWLTRNKFDKDSAQKELYQLAIKNFLIPGDKGFPLGGMVTAPKNRQETDALKQYFTQLRQETGNRLCEKIYAHDANTPSKWWMCYSKKKFMNQELKV